MPLRHRFILVFGSTALYFALAVLGRGGITAFFSLPPLAVLAAETLALAVAALFIGGNLSPGLREDRGNRWVIAAFGILGLLDAVLPAWTDRHGLWLLGGGDMTRWAGVVLSAIGGVLRLWPVHVLGHRFSGLVAIQPGHALVTGGLYGVVRHPSYLGLLIGLLGWGLAFRAGVGLLLTALTVPVVVARIRAEERLLEQQFGAEYRAYRRHTWRLIPGLY